MNLMRFLFLCILCVSGRSFGATEVNWPCFHGSRRDNLATDTGLMQTWPKDGPELAWTALGLGQGYSSVAINHHGGVMSLVRATPDRWDEVGSFRVPRGGDGLFWAHPVVCGGRLYVRHSDRLLAYNLKAH